MKKLICTISLALLFFQSGDACTVDIWTIEAGSVRGKVVDEYKNPIPNALIQIYKDRENGIEILAETKSDETGRFAIRNFPAGKYAIKAGAEQLSFTHSYASLKLKKSSNKKNKEIVFTLVPFGSCSGTVETRKISNTK